MKILVIIWKNLEEWGIDMDEIFVKKGDMVKCYFPSGKVVFGKVLSLPSNAHGPTVLQTYYEGKEDLICYVFNCEHMYIISRGD